MASLNLSLYFHQKIICMLPPARNSYLSILPDHNSNIFAASLLMSYSSFSSLILSSVVIICSYIVSKTFFLKRKQPSRVMSNKLLRLVIVELVIIKKNIKMQELYQSLKENIVLQYIFL